MGFKEKLNDGVLYITAAGIVVNAPGWFADKFRQSEKYTSELIGIPLVPVKPQTPMGPLDPLSTAPRGTPEIPMALTSTVMGEVTSGSTGPYVPPRQDGYAPIQPIGLTLGQYQVHARSTYPYHIHQQQGMPAAILAMLSEENPQPPAPQA